jgi:hypothetical protein
VAASYGDLGPEPSDRTAGQSRRVRGLLRLFALLALAWEASIRIIGSGIRWLLASDGYICVLAIDGPSVELKAERN